MHDPRCRFCLANEMLVDEPVARLSHFYLLGSIDPKRPAQSIIVPFRHTVTPFELNSAEWAELGGALDRARAFLDQFRPSGWTIGWNTGAAAGQEIFHTHLHVIARLRLNQRRGEEYMHCSAIHNGPNGTRLLATPSLPSIVSLACPRSGP